MDLEQAKIKLREYEVIIAKQQRHIKTLERTIETLQTPDTEVIHAFNKRLDKLSDMPGVGGSDEAVKWLQENLDQIFEETFGG